MNKVDAFDKWFEQKFCYAQGEDSPYSLDDVKEAFHEGWRQGREFKKTMKKGVIRDE